MKRTYVEPLVCGAIIALACMGAGAQRKGGVIYGAGTVQCGTYASDRTSGQAAQTAQYAAYAQGYLRAWNAHSMPQYNQIDNIPNFDTIFLFFDRYCRENPLDRVGNAVDALLAELGGYRQPYLSKRR